MKPERVFLVGAGPGDPGLLTLRGREILARAEVVVYDRLIPDSVLRWAPPDAELIYAGKSAGAHRLSQEEIQALLVEKAKAGHTVVRLKGGDPFVFGRGGEEVLALAEAGVEFEVVPGVTAAVGAAAYSGIALTHRDIASSVAFVTGHRAADSARELDWHTLARWNGTLVFYMGVANLERICSQLIQHGKDGQTGAAIVQNGCTPRQRTVRATLETLPERAGEADIQPPALIIVGNVAALRDSIAWYENRPLFGLRIVLTRPRHQIQETADRLLELGADPICMATARLAPPEDPSALERAVAELESYDWIIFTSVNGVESFFETLDDAGKDARSLASLQIACIGSATAGELREFGLRADLVPEEYSTEGLLKALRDRAAGQRILCPRSGIAPPDLVKGLSAHGAQVNEVAAYTLEPDNSNAPTVAQKLESNQVDWITFSSSSTVEHFFSAVEPALVHNSAARLASIGPHTSNTLRTRGFEPDVEASPHTMEDLIQAIISAKKTNQQ